MSFGTYLRDCIARQIWIRSIQDPETQWVSEVQAQQLLGKSSPAALSELPAFQLFAAPKTRAETPIPWHKRQLSKLGKLADKSSSNSDVHDLYDKLFQSLIGKKQPLTESQLRKALKALPMQAFGQRVLSQSKAKLETAAADLDKANLPKKKALSTQVQHLIQAMESHEKRPQLAQVLDIIDQSGFVFSQAIRYFEVQLDSVVTHERIEIHLAAVPIFACLADSMLSLLPLAVHTRLCRFSGFHLMPQQDPAIQKAQQLGLQKLSVQHGFDVVITDLFSQLHRSIEKLQQQVAHASFYDKASKEDYAARLAVILKSLPSKADFEDAFMAQLREGIFELHFLFLAGIDQAQDILTALDQALPVSIAHLLIDHKLHQLRQCFDHDPFPERLFIDTGVTHFRWILAHLKQLFINRQATQAAEDVLLIVNRFQQYQLAVFSVPFFQTLSLVLTHNQFHQLMDQLSYTKGHDVQSLLYCLNNCMGIPHEETQKHLENQLARFPKVRDNWLNNPHFQVALATYFKKTCQSLPGDTLKRLCHLEKFPSVHQHNVKRLLLGETDPQESTSFIDSINTKLHLLSIQLTCINDSMSPTPTHRFHGIAEALYQAKFHYQENKLAQLYEQCQALLVQCLCKGFGLNLPDAFIAFRQAISLFQALPETLDKFLLALSKEVMALPATEQDQIRHQLGLSQPYLSEFEKDRFEEFFAMLRHKKTHFNAEKPDFDPLIRGLISSHYDSGSQHPRTLLSNAIPGLLSLKTSSEIKPFLEDFHDAHAGAISTELPKSKQAFLSAFVSSAAPDPSLNPGHFEQLWATFKITHEQRDILVGLAMMLQFSPEKKQLLSAFWYNLNSHFEGAASLCFEQCKTLTDIDSFFTHLIHQRRHRDEQSWNTLIGLLPKNTWHAQKPHLAQAWLNRWLDMLNAALATGFDSTPISAVYEHLCTHLVKAEDQGDAHQLEPIYLKLLDILFKKGCLNKAVLALSESLNNDAFAPYLTWSTHWDAYLGLLSESSDQDMGNVSETQLDMLALIYDQYRPFLQHLKNTDPDSYIQSLLLTADLSHYYTQKSSISLHEKNLHSLLSDYLTQGITIQGQDNLVQEILLAISQLRSNPSAFETLSKLFFDLDTDTQHQLLPLFNLFPKVLNQLLTHHPESESTLDVLIDFTQKQHPISEHTLSLLIHEKLALKTQRFSDIDAAFQQAQQALQNAKESQPFDNELATLTRLLSMYGYSDSDILHLSQLFHPLADLLHVSVNLSQFRTQETQSPEESQLLLAMHGHLVLALLYVITQSQATALSDYAPLVKEALETLTQFPFYQLNSLHPDCYESLHRDQLRPIHQLSNLLKEILPDDNQQLLIPLFKNLGLFQFNRQKECLQLVYVLFELGYPVSSILQMLPTQNEEALFAELLYDHHHDIGLYVIKQLPKSSSASLSFLSHLLDPTDQLGAENTYLLERLAQTPPYAEKAKTITPLQGLSPHDFLGQLDHLRIDQRQKSIAGKQLSKTMNEWATRVKRNQLKEGIAMVLETEIDLAELFMPRLLLEHSKLTWDLMAQDDAKLSRIIRRSILKGDDYWHKPLNPVLQLLLLNPVFALRLLDQLNQELSSKTLQLNTLPINVLTLAIRHQRLSLTDISDDLLLVKLIKNLLALDNIAIFKEDIQQVFPLIFPMISERMGSSKQRGKLLSIPQCIQLFNFLAEDESAFLIWLSKLANNNEDTLKLLLLNIFTQGDFIAEFPNRESLINKCLMTIKDSISRPTLLSEALVEIIRQYRYQDAMAIKTFPKHVLRVIQHYLFAEDIPLTLRDLLTVLQSLPMLPNPFPETQLNSIQEAFLTTDQTQQLCKFAKDAPDIFHELLFQEKIIKSLYESLKIGFNLQLNELHDLVVSQLGKASKTNLYLFLSTYISEDVFGKDVRSQGLAALDQLMPVLDPFSYAEGQENLPELPSDANGHIDAGFVITHLQNYLNTPYVLIEKDDPFFTAAITALCKQTPSPTQIEPSQLLIHDLHQPDFVPSDAFVSTLQGICRSPKDLSIFLKHAIRLNAKWNSALALNMRRHWENSSSLYDQLRLSIALPSQSLLAEWVNHWASDFYQDIGEQQLTVQHIQQNLDFLLFLKQHQAELIADSFTRLTEQIKASFKGNPQLLIRETMTNNALPADWKQQLLLAYALCQDGKWFPSLCQFSINDSVFPSLWEIALQEIPEKTFKMDYLVKESDFDMILIENGPNLLYNNPHHILLIFDLKTQHNRDYYDHLIETWFRQIPEDEDAIRLSKTLMTLACETLSVTFIDSFTSYLLKQNRRITTNLYWLYDCLADLLHIPADSDGYETLVAENLLGRDGHMLPSWSVEKPLPISKTGSASRPELLQRLRQIHTAKHILLQLIFEKKMDYFFDTAQLKKHKSLEKSGLLGYALTQQQQHPKWQILIQDALNILILNHKKGPKLIRSFLSMLQLPQLHQLLFRPHQPDQITRAILEQLFQKNLVIQTVIDGQSKTRHMLKALIRYAIEQKTDPYTLIDTLILIFCYAPNAFPALIKGYITHLKDHYSFNFQGLIDGRGLMLRWLNFDQKPNKESLTKEAFTLLSKGFELIQVLAIVRSLQSTIPGCLSLFIAQLKHKLATPSTRLDLGDHTQTLAFLGLIKPGFSATRLTKNDLFSFNNAEILIKQLQSQQLLDRDGYVTGRIQDADFRDLFTSSIPKGTAYGLELMQSSAFFEKELHTFSMQLTDTFSRPSYTQPLQPLQIQLTFRWLSRHGLFQKTHALKQQLIKFHQHIANANAEALMTLDNMMLVVGLFTTQTHQLAKKERVQPFLASLLPDEGDREHIANTFETLAYTFVLIYHSDEQWHDALIGLFYHQDPLKWAQIEAFLLMPFQDQSFGDKLKERLVPFADFPIENLNKETLFKIAKTRHAERKNWEKDLELLFENPKKVFSRDNLHKLHDLVEAQKSLYL